MKFSIIIPILNAEKTLQSCLESVIKLDYPSDQYEIICVDNGSTDRSLSIIRQFKNICLLQEHRSKSSYLARSTGIGAARGEVLVFTDADCVVPADWLKRFDEAFQDPQAGAVAGKIVPAPAKTLTEEYQIKREVLSLEGMSVFPFGWLPITANAAYRSELFKTVGPFRDDLISGGDFELGERIRTQGHYRIITQLDNVVQHHHRTSVSAMIRQYTRYGIGRRHLEELRVFQQSVALTCANPLHYASIYFVKFLWWAFKVLCSPRFKGDRLKEIAFLWFDFITELSMRRGYAVALKRHPLNSGPVRRDVPGEKSSRSGS